MQKKEEPDPGEARFPSYARSKVLSVLHGN
jgi:hypothetical protein